MPPSLTKTLRDVGLSDKQALVLGVMLEGGDMLASSIARAAKLNRTTTYDILRELSGKGLVTSAKQRGVIRYRSIAAEQLPAYVERKRAGLEEAKKTLVELVPQIKLLRARGKALPKVRFFEGMEGVKSAYEDVAVNNQEKTLRGITGMDAVYGNLDAAWVKSFLEKRTRLGVKCIDIVPDTAGGQRSRADDAKYLRTTKFIPSEFNFDGDISIYDDKVALITYVQDDPIAVIIEDRGIATMMKKVFDFVSLHASI